jgi:hypothetical protein
MAFSIRFPSFDAITEAANSFQAEFDALREDIGTRFDGFGQDLSRIGDDLRARIEGFDSSDPARIFDGSAFRDAFAHSGIPGFDGNVDIRNLNDLATLADQLPGSLGQPDATGEVPTGSAAIGREEAAVATSLAAAPRIVETLGPTAEIVEVRGQSFSVAERYEDPTTGFSALHLTPVAGGADVFTVDGLEVGSRADEVAAATLGRLQVLSPEFQDMIADAAGLALGQGHHLLFAGPSLGGAVAQVAAYEAAEAITTAQRAAGVVPSGPDALHLVTVDPLGGRDAAETINGGTLSTDALQAITALNIRTDGDIVSRIGSHIGATLTLPALDREGNVVHLDAADAHVNVVSLLQNLSSDELFSHGALGAPAEISGFAQASNAASDELIAAWLASGQHDDATPRDLQIPGTASFDPTGTVWSLDADQNGTVDIAVRLSAPIDQARADLVLG